MLWHCWIDTGKRYSACLVEGGDVSFNGPAATAKAVDEMNWVKGVAAQLLLPQPGEEIRLARVVNFPWHLTSLSFED